MSQISHGFYNGGLIVGKALRFGGDEHHKKALEEITDFVFRVGLEQCFFK